MSWRGLCLILVLLTGCDQGSDGTALKGKVAAGAPRYVVGTLSATAAAATAPAADDYGDDAGQAHDVRLGEPISGRLEEPSDTDWFAIDLLAGVSYRFGLDCYGASRLVVIAPDGTELGQGFASGDLTVTPAVGGRYFVRVEAQAGRDLFYNLEIATTP